VFLTLSYPINFIYKFDPLLVGLFVLLDFFDLESLKSDLMSFSSNVLLKVVGFLSDFAKELSQDFFFHFF